MSANNSKFWADLGTEISNKYKEFHKQSSGKTPQERLMDVKAYFDTLLDTIYGRDGLRIQEFIEKRKPIDEKLKRIETDLKVKIKAMLGIEPISASSFSAGTNLLDESDLDFNIPVPDLDKPAILVKLSNICGLNGYEFVKVRSDDNPGIHYVFQGFVEGVEIEIKLRYAPYYKKVHHLMHDYLDNKMSKEHKATIAWIKHNLKQLSKTNKSKKEVYDDFKALYYEQGLANAGVYEMLYPLIEGGGKKNGRRTRRR
jgi:hypothetical protein